jgi:TPR repeat protein
MKTTWNLIGLLLIVGLALAPVRAATPTQPSVKASAKAKAMAKAKAKAKLSAKAKASANAKAKRQAKAPVDRPVKSENSSRFNPTDEAGLDAQVAAARRILSSKPDDPEARAHLAGAAVVLADWALRAEAVGDSGKARQLTQKLVRDLHDTGWRVQKIGQKGDLKARQAMGFFLEHGVLFEKDAGKSCVEYLAAAEQFSSAGWHAAQCLMEASPEKAWAQMELAAQRGHAAAQEWMGRRCLGEFGAKQKDFVCARTYLVESASLGRPRAQTLLAYLLMTGQGGAVDLNRAIRLYTTAAEKGDVDAQNNLGEINETGRGLTRNLDEAIRWYERAAEQGLGSAQFNAGRLWAIGVGDRKDPAKARALLVQAESKGIAQAREVLDWLDRQVVLEASESPALKAATTLDAKAKKD